MKVFEMVFRWYCVVSNQKIVLRDIVLIVWIYIVFWPIKIRETNTLSSHEAWIRNSPHNIRGIPQILRLGMSARAEYLVVTRTCAHNRKMGTNTIPEQVHRLALFAHLKITCIHLFFDQINTSHFFSNMMDTNQPKNSEMQPVDAV